MNRRIVALGVALCVCASLLFAQSFTGTILGTLRDTSGAVVPNAEIRLTNTDTNLSVVAQTDASGNYAANNLPRGNYTVEASAPGFKKLVREGITLAVQQQARLDLVLTIGEVAESVMVTANAQMIETTNASIGKVVDNHRIVNLPLNTRNVYSLIFLTPGVSGSVGNSYGDMRYSVNGARARMMDTLIDGVSASHATVTGFAGISVFPSVDAIEEFKVMGSNYSAEFGRSMGSVLNVVYKSGGNQFHGSAYEFLRNSAMDANNFFDNRIGRQLASFKRSQFGGTLSGPIFKDRTFFMVSYEGLRSRSFATRTTTVPTLLERQGDFSQTRAANGSLITIYNPFTTRREGTINVRDPFPGNRIPENMMDPVARNVLKFYPEPNIVTNALTNANNYSMSGSQKSNIDQSDYRVDQVISQSQRFFARYSTRLNESVPLQAFPDAVTVAEGRVIEEDHVHGAVADYTNSLSASTVLNGRMGFARTRYIYNNQGLGFKPSQLGLPGALDTATDYQAFPVISVGGLTGLGTSDHRNNVFNTYTGLANVSKIMASHNLKVGFEARLLRVNVREGRGPGSYSFSTAMTQGPNAQAASATAGNALASMLLGAGSSGTLVRNFKDVAVQSLYYAGYFQDDWRVTSKLTLNLGLRWDIDTPRTERYDRTNYFDPTIPSPLANVIPGLQGGLVFVGRDGRPRTQFPADKNNWAPRFGLAYQFDPKTVFRMGYAHLYGASHQAANGTIGTQGFRVDTPWVTSLDSVTPLNLFRDPYAGNYPPPVGASGGALTQLGGSIEAVLQNTISPWTRQMSVSIQREFPFQMMLETAYVGTRGFHLYASQESGVNLNQLPASAMALGSALNDQVPNPFYGRGGVGILANPTVARRQLMRPFPQFDNVNPLFMSGASSFYHSLQVTLTKRFSAGLQFEGSYTWAKNIDEGASHQDSYNIRESRTLSDIDLAHRFVMSFVYELPWGRGRHFGSDWGRLMDLAIGRWQVNGITTYQSGTPLSFSASNTANIFNPTIRPNNNGTSGKKDGPVHERLDAYFDRSAFSQPAPFTFGNMSPRHPDIRNDGVRNWDLSVFKDFAFTEKLRLQFRAEALNAFNTPRFGSPNTSVTSNAFGQITSQANAPRQMQLALKLLW